MQTFLPYANFRDTAAVLDYRRLGKQRVEAFQILTALQKKTGWSNHPATKMWRGHEGALCVYGVAMCSEWIARGYNDTMAERFVQVGNTLPIGGLCFKPPRWLGDSAFHAAHRSNLLRKDPDFYSEYGWTEPPDLPYIWPEGELNA